MVRLLTLGRLRLLREGLPREPVHLQPKRLALLAFLALSARDGVQQRDTLLALFWPRSDRDRARRCLRQALFHLRNELGEGAIVGAGREGVALVSGRIWCDAVAMEEALLRGRRREALSLYAGDFLPGLFVGGCATGLEEWVARTRQHLRARAAAGAWELVEQELQERRTDSALETARWARGLSPDDEQGLRRHMVLLARVGDPAEALGAYAEFTRRLLREYDAEPGLETRALAADLKHGFRPGPPLAATVWRAPPVGGGPTGSTARQQRRQRKGRRSSDAKVGLRRSLIGVLLSVGLTLGVLAVPHPVSPSGRHLLLAEFTNHTRDSLLGEAVTEAVRSELSRIAEVRLAETQEAGVPPSGDAQRGKVAAIVTGDVTSLGLGFTVSIRLVSAGSGRVLAVLREDAADSRLLLPAVERLSRRLRGKVILSLASADGTGR